MHTLNLGILAHVDAGKTSLTERLLYTAGVLDEVGSVDAGSTVTDSLELERRRGITIKSAVASFRLGGLSVNLIDTPGHADFIAEVERVLSVLDGAVLVISAVEGVQPQTRVLMRVLRRLGIPTLIFVNKVDRRGARTEPLLRTIAARLHPHVIGMGDVAQAGTAQAEFDPYDMREHGFRDTLLDRLTALDDALLADYVADEASVTAGRLRETLAAQSRAARLHPVFFGSAITGAGVDELVGGIRELLPPAPDDAGGPLVGTVFKVDRGAAGEALPYVRVYSGTARVRDRVRFGEGVEGRVTGIEVFAQGTVERRDAVEAGHIAKLRGLAGVRIGDVVTALEPPDGSAATSAATSGAIAEAARRRYFAPPTLETVVVPRGERERGRLHAALAQLAEQDPLINLRQDDVRRELSVSLYGEVQKEVIQSTLAEDYGVDADFRPSTTICVERLVGTGHAVEYIKKGGNPFLAGVGLRVEPAPPGSGVRFGYEIELGSLPIAFHKAIEETVRVTLLEGLRGWQVPDAVVTLTYSAYCPRQSHMHATFDKSMSSTAGDYRLLTPLVLFDALREAGTVVCEPMHRFRAEVPADVFSTLLPVLAGLRAVPRRSRVEGGLYVVEGEVPAGRVHEFEQLLPPLTRGEGVLETGFDHFQDVQGPFPSRPRTDLNPLDRKEYLLRVARRL